MTGKAEDGQHPELTASAWGEWVSLCNNPICWEMRGILQDTDMRTLHSGTFVGSITWPFNKQREEGLAKS